MTFAAAYCLVPGLCIPHTPARSGSFNNRHVCRVTVDQTVVPALAPLPRSAAQRPVIPDSAYTPPFCLEPAENSDWPFIPIGLPSTIGDQAVHDGAGRPLARSLAYQEIGCLSDR